MKYFNFFNSFVEKVYGKIWIWNFNNIFYASRFQCRKPHCSVFKLKDKDMWIEVTTSLQERHFIHDTAYFLASCFASYLCTSHLKCRLHVRLKYRYCSEKKMNIEKLKFFLILSLNKQVRITLAGIFTWWKSRWMIADGQVVDGRWWGGG